MKKVLLASLLVLLLSFGAVAQGVVVGDYPLSNHWNFDVTTIQFSFLQVKEGVQAGAASVEPLVAVGGGLTFYWGNKSVAPEYDAVIAFDVPTIFIKTDMNGNFSIMPAVLVGLLDNRACFGLGYDFADLKYPEQSRWTFLFSLGINLGS
jgi:hypothetical protein